MPARAGSTGRDAPAATRGLAPVIGVTCTYKEGEGHLVGPGYVAALEAAGAAPLLLPIADPAVLVGALHRLDGLVLTGGGDVDPSHYGEHRRVEPLFFNARRDASELALTRLALYRRLPLLAICRGVQVLNVAAGGTLVQDIPSEVPGAVAHHFKLNDPRPGHALRLAPASFLAGLAGGVESWVNSFHHQAVGRPAPGFSPAAWAPDGVVEALEPLAPQGDAFVLGVQWHPERIWETHPLSRKLFEALVAAAAGLAAGRVAVRPAAGPSVAGKAMSRGEAR